MYTYTFTLMRKDTLTFWFFFCAQICATSIMNHQKISCSQTLDINKRGSNNSWDTSKESKEKK